MSMSLTNVSVREFVHHVNKSRSLNLAEATRKASVYSSTMYFSMSVFLHIYLFLFYILLRLSFGVDTRWKNAETHASSTNNNVSDSPIDDGDEATIRGSQQSTKTKAPIRARSPTSRSLHILSTQVGSERRRQWRRAAWTGGVQDRKHSVDHSSTTAPRRVSPARAATSPTSPTRCWQSDVLVVAGCCCCCCWCCWK